MLDNMTPEQWQEWRAKDLVDPIGHRGTHEVLAVFAAMVAEALGAKDVDPMSFMWWREKQQEGLNVNNTAAIMALEAMGARRG